jgi:orotate phosphoribosyltransferase
MSDDIQFQRQEKAKANTRYEQIDIVVKTTLHCPELYDSVLRGIAGNVKMGPFTATSGVVLPYYLNATTNFLDKDLAPKIVDLFTKFLVYWLPPLETTEPWVVCGMEMAGGVLVSQLASANSELSRTCDFLYVRKEKKSTGTAQQLEGPTKYTSRTKDSPVVYGVFVDDALSTGSSLKDGAKLLKAQYNIEVKYVLYLVDRNHDRAHLEPDRLYLADPVFDSITIASLYDLDQVDALIPKK